MDTTKAYTLFQQAIQVMKRGDREQARKLMRQSLIENPKYAPAWLWMSGLVDDIVQQRECLERTLELDPNNQRAREGIEILKMQELIASMSQQDKKAIKQTGPHQTQKIGEYLVEQGIISHEQLLQALDAQRREQQNLHAIRVPLGDVLIKQGMLTPEKLATVLLEQQHDRIDSEEGKLPEYLGEYLITKEVVTREQLQTVLAQQMELRQKGKRILLGELLIGAGYISPDELEKILEQQRADIFQRFGFGDE